jgi:hypothetical protein
LPIQFEDKHQKLTDTLPNADALNIIANGLPTKTGNVWRSLVSMNKVYEA